MLAAMLACIALSACGGGSGGNAQDGAGVTGNASKVNPTPASDDAADSTTPDTPDTPTEPASSASNDVPASETSQDSDPASSVATLPMISIVTDAGAAIVDKENYIGANLTITNIDGTQAYAGHTGIKGRGNSTWNMPKRPYRLKLDSKSKMLGMPSDKNWVLLADYADKTLLRNRTALELSQRLGMAWTPRIVPVEVTLNGEYEGVYDLVESVRIDKNRVNITQIDDTTTTDPALGGYLLEINARMDEGFCWYTTQGVPFCLDDPDPSLPTQQAYIRSYIQSAEDALFSDHALDPATGYEAFIDMDSFINWYLIEELTKNVDTPVGLSVYLYKNANGKLSFGPVWDFDLALGNDDYTDATRPEGFWVASATWVARMKQIDPSFETRVRARWQAIKATQIDTLPSFIDNSAFALDAAQKRNFDRWPILGIYIWPDPIISGSYSAEVDYMRNWLTTRIAWMDQNL
ncbi:CotH kinase family protein [Caballeronia sp. LZ065]|uniref:CotH kinase family protein n=1 Tax=Caballeronia sp. LZ065 TaxID=3038571 RepID=UPI00285DA1D2|nr:CotH kinase family protein [Caballeronia sp. LZ065]MDR5778890.1 CotH kinase family protein [Caballeronia sp. LZ065]